MPSSRSSWTLADFDFELAARADRPAPRARAQRLAPARRHRRCSRWTASSATCPALLEPRRPAGLQRHPRDQGAPARRARPAAVRSRCWSSACCRPTRCWPTCARASRRRPGSRAAPGRGAFDAEVLGRGGPDGSLFRLRFPGDPFALLEAPRPRAAAALHHARRRRRRRARATRPCSPREPGAVAAPTAALHFDDALLDALRERGVGTAQRHAARRRRHLPAGAQREPGRAPHAQRVVTRCRRPPSTRSRATRAARRARRGRGHHHAARAGIGRAGRRRCSRRAARPTSSSRRASSSASSTGWSPTSTCRKARC